MKKRIFSLLPLALVLAVFLCAPAFALTEAEVEAQVAASSKETVTGNVLIWFFCAVAFLKVSQKIDSILGTLGINVGRTGGSLMAEAMIAARGVTMIAKAGGHAIGGAVRSGGGAAQGAPSGSTGGFFKGGLIGMAGRHITNSAVKTATSQTANLHTAQSQTATSAMHTASSAQSEGVHTASSVHSGVSHTVNAVQGSRFSTASSGTVHTDSSFQSGGVNTDTSGIIQTENSVQSAAMQSDTSVISGQDSTSSEAFSDSAVFADAIAQQEGVIITGHESQSSVHSDSNSQTSGPGAPSAPSGPNSAPSTPSGGSAQVSQSTNSSQTVYAGGGSERVHTQSSATETAHTQSDTHTVRQTSIGGAVFARSLASGGKFANDVIGTVARGDIRSTGSITGDLAAQSLSSYMGHTALGAGARNIPRYSDVEIGGGRITGTEYKPGSQEGLAFGMYHAGQYAAPEGPHQKVHSADGTLWFKQYAQDAVERKPYKAPDGTVAYEEKIVKKLPNPPKRKDRI